MTKFEIAESMKALQARIVKSLEELDGKQTFSSDEWYRKEGGGGITKTIKNGAIIEKGGVAFSAVHGEVTPAMKKQLNLEGDDFFATGVSIVLHPNHPMVPIIHMNVRFFELNTGVYWFGGGIDLTPHYVDEKLAKAFHLQLKSICDEFNSAFYSKFKPWADDYFYIPHREETRGVGGIFYDHQDEQSSGVSKGDLFNFAMKLGDSLASIYKVQVLEGQTKLFTETNKEWQFNRRGRYVEFNLAHDRGTKFGLYSGGRTESILMSLPPQANWEYCFQVEDGSEENKTLNLLKKGINWASI
jgi:coproporphyrinogen III oxidase